MLLYSMIFHEYLLGFVLKRRPIFEQSLDPFTDVIVD